MLLKRIYEITRVVILVLWKAESYTLMNPVFRKRINFISGCFADGDLLLKCKSQNLFSAIIALKSMSDD